MHSTLEMTVNLMVTQWRECCGGAHRLSQCAEAASAQFDPVAGSKHGQCMTSLRAMSSGRSTRCP